MLHPHRLRLPQRQRACLLRGWTPDGITRALTAVAEADALVKGEGANPGYALEVAVRTIVASRASR